MRKRDKKIVKKRMYIMLGLCIALICVLGVFGITLGLQIHDLKVCVKSAVDSINTLENNNVVYETKLNKVYIPKTVTNSLVEHSLHLSIHMPDAILDITEDYVGLVEAPNICKQKIEIQGIKVNCVKASNISVDAIQDVSIKVESIKELMPFPDVLDVYEHQGEEYILTETVKCEEYISVKSSEQYFVYIAPTAVSVEEGVVLYNNIPQNIAFSILPENATYIEPTYSNYDENFITITEEGKILPIAPGITKLVCSVGDISCDVNVEILPTVEKINVNKPTVTIKLGNWSYVIAATSPEDAANTELIWTSSNEEIATVEDGMIKSQNKGQCVVTVATELDPKVLTQIKVTVTDKASGYYTQGTGGYPETIVEGPYYVDGILIVNKKYALPDGFAKDLDIDAVNALKQLQAAAKSVGYSLPMVSGFRTYSFQKRLYESYIRQSGQGAADTFSARPGHSEHSAGLAFDVGSVTDSYGTTPAGKWLEKNCHKYGFILRYPQGKSDITGYKYEPWHIRYLGVENATKVYESGLTLEEYLKLN